MAVFAAVDLGASGGRVMRADVTSERLTIETVHRFPNGVGERDGHLRWDIATLFEQVRAGLRELDDVVSIGIDTWGVDYGLLDDAGELLADPISYRDDRTSKVVDEVHQRIGQDELYAITGIQHLKFNTIYQLDAERHGPLWDRARTAVLLPDLLAYWLTGELRTEITNASTTGLLDARTHEFSADVLARVGLPRHLFPPLQEPGDVRGRTVNGTVVTTVGSHDTASAVVGVPASTDRFAYISSGTWSLVGVELDAPVLTEAARDANFTNEVGVDGRTRFLRNVGGLWLVQECLRSWQRDDIAALVDQAARLPSGGPIVDVDDPIFLPPGRMPERIAAAAGVAAMTPAQTTRCVIDSLAHAYARVVQQASALSGRPVDVIHLVGGGSQNDLLCRLTADAAQVPVLAGPVEATAIGNALVQARAHGDMPRSLDDMRAQLAASIDVRRYSPS